MNLRAFPDGETLARIEGQLEEYSVLLACTLDRPDAKLLPLAFAADAARDLGAARIGLVAPYLGYLRQDRRFHDGEAGPTVGPRSWWMTSSRLPGR